MRALTLVTRSECHLCDVMQQVLATVQAEHPFELRVVDVDSADELRELYGDEVPVLFVDGRKAFKYRVTADELRHRLNRGP